jgi:hypothetical protein
MTPRLFFLRANVAGKTSIQGPAPLGDYLAAYSRGQLGDHCELMEANGLSRREALKAMGWQRISNINPKEMGLEDISIPPTLPEPKPSTEDLLIRLVIAQEIQNDHIRRISQGLVFISILILILLIKIIS